MPDFPGNASRIGRYLALLLVASAIVEIVACQTVFSGLFRDGGICFLADVVSFFGHKAIINCFRHFAQGFFYLAMQGPVEGCLRFRGGLEQLRPARVF